MLMPKYIVITDDDVLFFRNEEEIEKKFGIIEKPEFKKIGDKYIIKMNKSDLEFVRDRKMLVNALQILFKPKLDLTKIMLVIQIVTILILLGKK